MLFDRPLGQNERLGDSGVALALSDLAENIALARSEIGQREGFVRLFVDEGPLMARLLREAAATGLNPEYCLRLLSAFSTDTAGAGLGGRASPGGRRAG